MTGIGGKWADYRLVNIPAGTVAMRDDRVNRAWTAVVDAFSLAPTPVTQSLYGAIMQQPMDSAAIPEAPIVNVSWLDAVRFCNLFSQFSGLQSCYAITEVAGEAAVEWDTSANGYRLPTETEWQYACKAGTSGYQYGELDAVGWYRDNSSGHLHEVGHKLPNAWHLYDMLGNVWEWCWDQYDPQVYGSYRVFRGGSWAEEARGCGATCRRRSHPTFRIDDLGFRLARSLTNSAPAGNDGMG